MHAAVAAGKLTDIAFDDDAKRITVVAKIVDDDEWRKVQEGVYTGFSQGGRYVKRWADADSGLTRYTADPHEISLVDLPCVPDATFDVVKDGVVEKTLVCRAPRRGDRTPMMMTSMRATMISTPTRVSFRPRSVKKTPKRASPCPTAAIRSGPPRTLRTP